MRGTITGKDVFLHSHTIVRLFGLSTFLACAWAAIVRRRSTFLGVLYQAPPAPSEVPSPAALGNRPRRRVSR